MVQPASQIIAVANPAPPDAEVRSVTVVALAFVMSMVLPASLLRTVYELPVWLFWAFVVPIVPVPIRGDGVTTIFGEAAVMLTAPPPAPLSLTSQFVPSLVRSTHIFCVSGLVARPLNVEVEVERVRF
jgi:hypothetical protein